MALNYYDGWTEAELLAERKRVQQRLSGGSVIEAGAAGVRTVKKHEASPGMILENIAYSLYVLNPTDYPIALRQSRTKAAVWSGDNVTPTTC